MLKRFFLVVCGSFVGTFLALLFFTLTAIVMSFVIFGSMSSVKGNVSIEKNSIMYVKLDGMLNERDGGANASLMMLMPNNQAHCFYGLGAAHCRRRAVYILGKAVKICLRIGLIDVRDSRKNHLPVHRLGIVLYASLVYALAPS